MKRTGLGVRESLSESQKLPVSSWREDEKAFQTVIKANTKALRQACHSQKDRCQKDCRRTLGKGGGGARPGKTQADHTGPPTLWRGAWVLMHPAWFPGWGAKVRRGRSLVKVTEHPSVEAIRYSHFLTELCFTALPQRTVSLSLSWALRWKLTWLGILRTCSFFPRTFSDIGCLS